MGCFGEINERLSCYIHIKGLSQFVFREFLSEQIRQKPKNSAVFFHYYFAFEAKQPSPRYPAKQRICGRFLLPNIVP